MITDRFELLENVHVDVCVVGAGLVGCCLAEDLRQRGLSVLVLESGLTSPNRKHQSLSDAEILDPLNHHPMAAAVSRSLGGTSRYWGGRCVPLDRIDFERREYIPNSGWPVKYDEFNCYLPRAAALLGCDDGPFFEDSWKGSINRDIDFSGIEHWVNETNVVRRFPALRRSEDVKVLLNATVVGLEIEPHNPVIKGLRVAREGRAAIFAGAKTYVLALGGIETTRLLLNVQIDHPQLFGGSSGALGQYYMGHASEVIACLRLRDPRDWVHFKSRPGKFSFSRRRLRISDEAQRKNKIPNIAFWPDNPPYSNPDHESGLLSGMFFALRFPGVGSRLVPDALRDQHLVSRSELRRHARNLLCDAGGLAEGFAEIAWQRARFGRRVPRLFIENGSGVYPIRFHAETIPSRSNSVRLVESRDWLGVRRVCVDYKVSDDEFRGIIAAHRLFDESLRRLGIGELSFVNSEKLGSTRWAADGLHQIGLTRMADTVADGIVDSSCRIFEWQNLFIAGSSVFPTSGQANPTLPAVTLAVRLAEHLAKRVSMTPANPIASRSIGNRSSDPLKILFVTASYYPAVRYGGPTYTVHSLARHLVKLGHRVVVYTTDVDGDRHLKNNSGTTNILDGVEVTYFRSKLDKIYWSPDMIRALKAHAGEFDIIHGQGAFLYPSVGARRAAVSHNRPFVYTPRGMLVPELIRRKNWLAKAAWLVLFERNNFKIASTIHATSELEAKNIGRLNLRANSLAIIPNGVGEPEGDSHEVEAARRTKLTGTSGAYVLFLGRVSWVKGIDRLIDAMTLVPERKLIIAGNDDENHSEKLRRLAQKLGIDDRIVFTGAVYGVDKYSLLRGADLLVLPSHSENFGVVVLEAMSCGVPVIMTPEVGIAHAVSNFGAGITVEGTPAKLAEAINSLLSDAERRRRMGVAGRESATKHYSWETIAKIVEENYRTCLTKLGRDE